MNVVFISPHFPLYFHNFCSRREKYVSSTTERMFIFVGSLNSLIFAGTTAIIAASAEATRTCIATA